MWKCVEVCGRGVGSMDEIVCGVEVCGGVVVCGGVEVYRGVALNADCGNMPYTDALQ